MPSETLAVRLSTSPSVYATATWTGREVDQCLVVPAESEAERRPGRRPHDAHFSLRWAHDERQVPGGGDPEGGARAVHQGIEGGGERVEVGTVAPLLLDGLREVEVEQTEDLRRRQVGVARRSHCDPGLAHQGGGTDAVPGDVPDPEADPAAPEVEDVPPVSADRVVPATRHVAGSDRQAGGLRRPGGEQGPLQLLRHPPAPLPGPNLGDGRPGPRRQILSRDVAPRAPKLPWSRAATGGTVVNTGLARMGRASASASRRWSTLLPPQCAAAPGLAPRWPAGAKSLDRISTRASAADTKLMMAATSRISSRPLVKLPRSTSSRSPR